MAEQTKENALKMLKAKGWRAGEYLSNGVSVVDYRPKAKKLVSMVVKAVLKKGK